MSHRKAQLKKVATTINYKDHSMGKGHPKQVKRDVKRLKPKSRKLPKGKGVKRDVVMTSKFERARKKMYGLSAKEDAGKI